MQNFITKIKQLYKATPKTECYFKQGACDKIDFDSTNIPSDYLNSRKILAYGFTREVYRLLPNLFPNAEIIVIRNKSELTQVMEFIGKNKFDKLLLSQKKKDKIAAALKDWAAKNKIQIIANLDVLGSGDAIYKLENPESQLYDRIINEYFEKGEQEKILVYGFDKMVLDSLGLIFPKADIWIAKQRCDLLALENVLNKNNFNKFIISSNSHDIISNNIRTYAAKNSIPVWSGSPAPIYSVNAGINKYLLGMQFDCESSNGNVFCEYNLEERLNDSLPLPLKKLHQIEDIMEIFKYLKITKTTHPSLKNVRNIIKFTGDNNILILGSSTAKSMANKGKENKYSINDIYKIAIKENPEANLYYYSYRGDPLIESGLPKGVEFIEAFYNIWDILEYMDKIYTIDSELGILALIKNKPVTLFGHVFYGGWGLTDDRVAYRNRKRNITLPELFYYTYINYPFYVIKSDDEIVDFMASIFRAYRHREESTLRAFMVATKKDDPIDENQDNYFLLWTKTFIDYLIKIYSANWVQHFPWKKIFAPDDDDMWQRLAAFYILGYVRKRWGNYFNKTYSYMLESGIKVRNYIFVLQKFAEYFPSANLYLYISKALEKLNIYDAAFEYLKFAAEYDAKTDIAVKTPFSDENVAYYMQLYRMENEGGKLESALNSAYKVLISGFTDSHVFWHMSLNAMAKGSYQTAYKLQMLAFYNDTSFASHYMNLYAALSACIHDIDILKAISRMIMASDSDWPYLIFIKTNFTVSPKVDFQDKNYLESFPLLFSLFRSQSNYNINELNTLQIIAELGYPKLSLYILNKLKLKKQDPNFLIIETYCYYLLGEYQKAYKLIKNILHMDFNIFDSILLSELTWMSGDIQLAQKFIDFDVPLPVGTQKIIYSILTDDINNFKCCAKEGRSIILKKYFQNKFIDYISELRDEDKNILLLSISGLGDELTYSAFYGNIHDNIKNKNLFISCEPRLTSLLSRSYPEIKFVPSNRLRNLFGIKNIQEYLKLKNTNLHGIGEDHIIELAKKCDKVGIVPTMLGELSENSSLYPRKPFLIPDSKLVSKWRTELERVARGRIIVGITWRSGQINFERSRYYFNFDELSPLFSLENILFVNLQYGSNEYELKMMRDELHEIFFHPEELDLTNDMENVSALIAATDYVISVSTTVQALAEGLGKPTLFMTKTIEPARNKEKNSNKDRRFPTTIHPDYDKLANNTSIMTLIMEELKTIIQKHNNINSSDEV